MQFQDIVNFGFEAWKAGDVSTPMTLLGAPGIGKSSIAPQLAEKMTDYVRGKHPNASEAVCEVIDLSSRLPEDIGGIPYRGEMQLDKDNSIVVAEYGVQKWLARLCQPGVYGVLLLDDLPASAPSVQVAVRQLVLDRKVGEYKLSDGVLILVTGNRREDKSAASTLPAHFRNSVMLMELEVTLDEWTDWYGSQRNHAPIVASFLRYRPNLLSKLPKDADRLGAFPTPRTWAKLGAIYDVAHRLGCDRDAAQGLVGEGAAVEFMAFVNVRSQLVDPASVLRNPEKALPNPAEQLQSADRAYAMATGIAETAAAWRTGKDPKLRDEAPLMLMRATGHCTVGNREYIATAVSTYTSNGGNIKDLITAAREHMAKDPLVKSVIDFLTSTYN